MRSLCQLTVAILALATTVSLHAATPVDTYQVVARLPHSTSSYTEGFFYLDGLFYEGTGMSGRSALLAIDPSTGQVRQRHDLPGQYFGEGIVDVGSDIYEWTWQSHIGFVLDRFTFQPTRQFTYTGEGWGMTRTSTQLITSDGSAILRFRDPKTFKELRHITVTDAGKPIPLLNELEYIHGEIYANIWHTNRIARISPKGGHVLRWLDLTGLLPASQMVDAESVLNGIAYDTQHDRLYVTGKQWPAIFQIKILSKAK